MIQDDIEDPKTKLQNQPTINSMQNLTKTFFTVCFPGIQVLGQKKYLRNPIMNAHEKSRGRVEDVFPKILDGGSMMFQTNLWVGTPFLCFIAFYLQCFEIFPGEGDRVSCFTNLPHTKP